MINHVSLFVSDVERSRGFYEQVLRPLGYKQVPKNTSESESVTTYGFCVENVNGKRDFWIKQIDEPLGKARCLA